MNYLIIGGTGTLGHQLTTRILKDPDNTIWIFSRDENKQWAMKRSFNKKLNFIIGDIADSSAVVRTLLIAKPHVIILAAAQKHIDICEYNPYSCIDTNILGTKTCIEAIRMCKPVNLQKVLFISTDKACNPVNIYGQSKSISEKLMAYAASTIPEIKFLTVRYGNVFNSRGSLIDLLENNGEQMEYISLTHPEMTRFFMTKLQAETLIFDTLEKGESGELWIRKAPSFLIKNIIDYYAIKYDKEVKITGLRPGEKIHEELFSTYEYPKIVERGDYYILTMNVHNTDNYKNYKSDNNNLSYDETVDYITRNTMCL